MLPDDDHDPEDCRALSEILGRVGDRWTILVIGLLSVRPRRFNEIRRMIEGISQRMLTLTLRGLERDGLVSRTQQPTNPPAVEYALTERGKSLLVHLIALATWGREHRVEIERSRSAFDRGRVAGATTPESP